MRLAIFSAAVACCLTFANFSEGCGTAADCSAGPCEAAVCAPAVIVHEARVAILPRLRGCGLFQGVRYRRAARIERRAVRRAVCGRRLFRGRLLRGGCCG